MSIDCNVPADGVVRLTLNRPPVNALDLASITALTQAFTQLAGDPPATGVLLTGVGKAFSAGVDVRAFAEMDAGARLTLARSITAMVAAAVAVPCPMVAMIGGHALGGGLVLALCADWRCAPDDPQIKLGLLEAKAGVPFPSGPMAALRHLLPGNLLRRLALTSETLSPQEMQQQGVIDGLCEGPDLLPHALNQVRLLASQPGFSIVKRQTLDPLIRELTTLVETGREPFWAPGGPVTPTD